MASFLIHIHILYRIFDKIVSSFEDNDHLSVSDFQDPSLDDKVYTVLAYGIYCLLLIILTMVTTICLIVLTWPLQVQRYHYHEENYVSYPWRITELWLQYQAHTNIEMD